uniref:PKD domain-containing protein n=1 Tax=Crocinitomix algicola TaxID=1740263 RepID=UPI001112F32D
MKLTLALLFSFLSLTIAFSQSVPPYTGIDYATDYTNPSEGGPCGDITNINLALGDADFEHGTAEVPLGWSFSGTWNSGTTYFDGPGDEVLLVSLHTYTESWHVALRLSDGTTTDFQDYDLTLVTSDGTGPLSTCWAPGGGSITYERPSQLLDFADYTIPAGVGVIGIVFEPYADGAANPDPHGVLILEGTPFEDPCEADETPTSYFEFVIGEDSSEDGITGSCYINEVQFNSLAEDPISGVITEWNWSFGDGSTSTDENPTHTYGAPGTYTVTLTVTTGAGCTATYTMDIIMTEGLSLDFIINDPSCYGFSDGSITVNVEGAGGDLVFDITNEDGETINEDNSNTANSLTSGWYYVNVSDGTDCDGIGEIFLDQPGELDIDLTITDPLCFGFETGWVK